MFLLIGLGNPGKKYQNNRHNIGFMVIDKLLESISFSKSRNFEHGTVYEGYINSQKVILLKPTNYMNNSGYSALNVLNFFKVPSENILVFHDDIDLLPGNIRFKQGGGHGGHNGIKDLILHIGNNFKRIRIGIGHPGHRDLVCKHVLGNFNNTEDVWLQSKLDLIIDNINHLITNDAKTFLSQVSQLIKD